MLVLVDYDNIPELERARGPVYVATRIVDALATHLGADTELHLRFYGGWFNGAILSHRAQQLAPIIRSEFPRQITTTANGAPVSLLARAELALALASSPSKYLTHTYRERPSPKGIRSFPLPYSGCRSPSACALATIAGLFRDSQCPEQHCTVALDAVLFKPEQKLIDTMLAVDMVEQARASGESIAIVSADDDIWPAILAASVQGTRVVHVHPVTGRRTPPQYASLAGALYVQCSF